MGFSNYVSITIWMVIYSTTASYTHIVNSYDLLSYWTVVFGFVFGRGRIPITRRDLNERHGFSMDSLTYPTEHIECDSRVVIGLKEKELKAMRIALPIINTAVYVSRILFINSSTIPR